jgi:hypothetical protein
MNRSLRNDHAVGRQGNMGHEIGIMKTPVPYRTFRRVGDWTRIWGYLTIVEALFDSWPALG